MQSSKFLYVAVFTSLVLSACKSLAPTPTGLVSEKAMVVSAREEASKIGVQIIKNGGNAFDAMVATEMALVVAYPFAGNLGGGGVHGLSHVKWYDRRSGLS